MMTWPKGQVSALPKPTQVTHLPTRCVRGHTLRECSSTKNWDNLIYLCTIVKKGHTALSIDPHLSYIFDPIPPEKVVRIEEGSLCVASYTLGVSFWGTFRLAVFTRGAWAPFSGTVPSFQFNWAADLDACTSGHSQIKCPILLQW